MKIPIEDVEDRDEINKKLANAIEEVNKANFRRENDSLKKILNTKGRSAAIFDLKQRVVGSEDDPPEAVVLEDPDTGRIVDSPEEIKRVSLKYCKDLLTNRTPKEEFEDIAVGTQTKVRHKYSCRT